MRKALQNNGLLQRGQAWAKECGVSNAEYSDAELVLFGTGQR